MTLPPFPRQAALVAVGVGLAIAAACAVLWRQSSREVEATILQRVEALSSLHAARADLQLASMRATMRARISDDRRLSGLMRQVQSASEAERVQPLASLTEVLGAQTTWLPASSDWLLLSPAGTVLASSLATRTLGSDASLTDCFQHLGTEGVTAADVSARNGEVGLVSLSTPVRDGAGSLLGVVCLHVPLASHAELVAAHREPMAPMIYLVDGSGRVLDASFEEGRDPRLGQALPGSPIELAGLHEPWRGQHRSGGRSMVSAFTPMSSLGYGVMVQVDRELALAPLRSVGRRALGVSILFAGLALGLAYFFAWRASRMAQPPVPLLSPPTPGPSASLDSSREFSELLLNALDSRVTVIAPDFRVLRSNTAALLRYRNLPALDAHSLFEGAPGPCPTCPVCQAFSTGNPASADTSEGAGSLTELVQVQALPLKDAKGTVYAVLRLSRVITAEKQMQAQLMLREKMSAFGLLAAGVAHEIGNPLAAISSQLRLAREAPAPGRTEATLEVVGREVARIQELLRDLVNFARRPRSGHSLVSLDTSVEDVWRLISHDPRARSVTIERKKSQTPPAVRAKEDHLVQVLLNLGINALDAMPDGGTLTFATSVEDAAAVVRVSDTGKGIPEAAQKRLFEPFFTTKDVGRGTGLGLFVSKGLIRELKGSLVVESTGPDGTVFCLRLPLAIP